MREWSRRVFSAAMGVGATLGAAIVFADVTIPNKFVPNTPIKSSEVNANFDALNAGKQDKVVAFIHVASPTNISNNYTFIDNPATNGNPNAILIVTPNRSPAGGAAPFYYGSVSVSYGSGKWAILHDKGPSEPVADKEAFNVLVLK